MTTPEASKSDPRSEKKSRFPLGGPGNCIAVLLLVSAFTISVANVIKTTNATVDTGNKKVLYLGHWQLEGGVREAWQLIIDEYEKRHPDVKIIQQAVTERVYPQWLRTQMVGGMGADMMEFGAGGTARTRTMAQYFEPISRIVNQPNPYNKGTDLEGVPWRLTYNDAMRGSYRDDLVDYYGVPIFIATTRVYYNKDLFRKVLGTDKPPANFSELKDYVARFRQYAKDHGISEDDLTGLLAQGKTDLFEDFYAMSFTAPLLQTCDVNLDGSFGGTECYLAWRRGEIKLDSPRWRAYHELLQELAGLFQTGFKGASREDTISRFINGKAAMFATGSWDAAAMSQNPFEVGAFAVPLPDPKDPKYGKYCLSPVSEAGQGAQAGGFIGVTRFSKHPDLAIDFLMFATSKEMHQKFSDRANLIPAIKGTIPAPSMKPFMPQLDGYIGFKFGRGIYTGSATGLKYKQEMWPFMTGNITYDQLIKEVDGEMTRRLGTGELLCDWEWADGQKLRRRQMQNSQFRLDVLRVKAVDAADAKAQAEMDQRYLALINQQISEEIAITQDDSRVASYPPIK